MLQQKVYKDKKHNIILSKWEGENMILNEKAQAFSTFKLLIAAVVAMAILAILMGIISTIVVGPNTDPVSVIKGKLDAAEGSLSTMKTTAEVVVGSEAIAASALAQASQTGLGKDQICFINSASITNAALVSDGASFRNKGGNTKVKFSIICNRNAALQDDLELYLEDDAPDVGDCDSFGDLGENEVTCAIVVRNPKD